jgi:plastocyanin
MVQPGKIAFPVILVLGAITGYITYVSFTAAMPGESKIDSPYYQPLPPASEENEAGNTGGGGAAQQGGGGAAQQGGGGAAQQGGGGAAQQGGGGAAQQGGGGAAQQGGGGAAPGGGAVTLTILEGSSIQGSPDYDPDELTVAAGSDVTVANQDTLPHTVTSGTSPTDPNSAQLFDTSLINGGESATLSLAQVAAGQYDYYCMVHPYMTGKLVVQ